MEVSNYPCSLEKMIGFIAKINGIEMLRFVFYTPSYFKRKPDRKYVYFSEIGKLIEGEIKFRHFLEKRHADEILGIDSLVKIGGGRERYIPMVDFNCAISARSLLRVKENLRLLGQDGGFILESGKSYHYYGIKLMVTEEWFDFMKKCKSSDIIGGKWLRPHKWVTYSLKRKCSTLRISTGCAKPHLPEVVVKVGDFEI